MTTWGPYDNERTDAEKEAKKTIRALQKKLIDLRKMVRLIVAEARNVAEDTCGLLQNSGVMGKPGKCQCSAHTMKRLLKNYDALNGGPDA
jgi:hypothetical protein